MQMQTESRAPQLVDGNTPYEHRYLALAKNRVVGRHVTPRETAAMHDIANSFVALVGTKFRSVDTYGAPQYDHKLHASVRPSMTLVASTTPVRNVNSFMRTGMVATRDNIGGSNRAHFVWGGFVYAGISDSGLESDGNTDFLGGNPSNTFPLDAPGGLMQMTNATYGTTVNGPVIFVAPPAVDSTGEPKLEHEGLQGRKLFFPSWGAVQRADVNKIHELLHAAGLARGAGQHARIAAVDAWKGYMQQTDPYYRPEDYTHEWSQKKEIRATSSPQSWVFWAHVGGHDNFKDFWEEYLGYYNIVSSSSIQPEPRHWATHYHACKVWMMLRTLCFYKQMFVGETTQILNDMGSAQMVRVLRCASYTHWGSD